MIDDLSSFSIDDSTGSSASSIGDGAELSSTFSAPAGEFLRKYRTRDEKQEVGEGSIVGNYRLGRVLGVGGFSRVYEAEPLSGEGDLVAVKVVSRLTCEADVVESAREETALWKELDHPHIVTLIDVIETPEAFCVVSQLANGGTLLSYVNEQTDSRVPERDACRIFLQLCDAARYLHSLGIVHGDIKLDNILLDDDLSVKLADFGLSFPLVETVTSEEELLNTNSLPSTLPINSHASAFGCMSMSPTSSFPKRMRGSPTVGGCAGTLLYCAPEMLRAGQTTFESDVWAIGVCLYAMLAGNFPFDDEYAPRLQMLITRGRLVMPEGISANAQSLLASLLCVDPAQRSTLEEVCEHPWCIDNQD